jgi:ATP synthase protein I
MVPVCGSEAHRAAVPASISPDPLQYTGSVPLTSQTTLQLIGQLSTIGFSFVFAIAIGFGGGLWLDGKLGTKPWLTFLGFFVGVAAGVLNVYRIMKLADASRSDRSS